MEGQLERRAVVGGQSRLADGHNERDIGGFGARSPRVGRR